MKHTHTHERWFQVVWVHRVLENISLSRIMSYSKRERTMKSMAHTLSLIPPNSKLITLIILDKKFLISIRSAFLNLRIWRWRRHPVSEGKSIKFKFAFFLFNFDFTEISNSSPLTPSLGHSCLIISDDFSSV